MMMLQTASSVAMYMFLPGASTHRYQRVLDTSKKCMPYRYTDEVAEWQLLDVAEWKKILLSDV